MSDALNAIQAIPVDAIHSAAGTGLLGFALIAGGAAFYALSMNGGAASPEDAGEDSFESALVGEQLSKNNRFAAVGVAAIGLLICVFAVFTATGLEGSVALDARNAETAAEEGDWEAAANALESACTTIQCNDDSADVIVKPELQQQVATAWALSLLMWSQEARAAGDSAKALELSERAYKASSSKATVDAMNRMQSEMAQKLESEGDHEAAARAFEEADDFVGATRNYEKAERHEDLCRLYPNIPEFIKAAEACAKSGNLGRAGWYYKAGGDTQAAADAYLKSGRKQEGINLLLEDAMLEKAAQEYTRWAGESEERAADRYLAAAGLYEELGQLETSLAQKRLAADAYAQLADTTQNSTQRIAAWQLYKDLEDSESAATQMEFAIAKAGEFKSVGGLMELVRLNGEIGRGIDIVRGWADDAINRNEPHEAAQYLSLLLGNLMGDLGPGADPAETLSEEELSQMQTAMPALLATNQRIADKVAEYPTIEVKAFAVSTTFPDSDLQIHNHTTLEGTVTNPHDVPIEAISLRVILFEPRFDTQEIQVDGWRKIMSERGISEEEARKIWDEQTSEREKELYSAPVGFREDIDLGRIEPGQTIQVREKLDSDVSYQYIDHYFVGMKR